MEHSGMRSVMAHKGREWNDRERETANLLLVLHLLVFNLYI